jgi:hypothetical protein
MFVGNALEAGEGLLEGLQVIEALRFDDGSCCHKFLS